MSWPSDGVVPGCGCANGLPPGMTPGCSGVGCVAFGVVGAVGWGAACSVAGLPCGGFWNDDPGGAVDGAGTDCGGVCGAGSGPNGFGGPGMACDPGPAGAVFGLVGCSFAGALVAGSSAGAAAAGGLTEAIESTANKAARLPIKPD